VASEVAPYAKTGGLADVAGALPAAQAALGLEVATVMPCYRGLDGDDTGMTVDIWLGYETHRVRLLRAPDDPSVWLVDVPGLFDRTEPQGSGQDLRAQSLSRIGIRGIVRSWCVAPPDG